MTRFSGFVKGVGAVVSVIVATAVVAFRDLEDVADAIRRLKPLGERGWAISTYGLMLAPGPHFEAAADGICVEEAALLLEDAWSDETLQRRVCTLAPWVYRPEDREIGYRRQQLLERASRRFSYGHYAEAVLLVYSQIDGMFQDRAAEGEQAFGRVFSRRPVRSLAGEEAVQFADLVMESRTIAATEQEFYLSVRGLMSESVTATTLEDHPSRHGVLHGRVLGFDNRLRAAQAFAFLTASLEFLVASRPQAPIAEGEYRFAPPRASEGLQLILQANTFSPIRSVYLAGLRSGSEVFFAVPDISAARPIGGLQTRAVSAPDRRDKRRRFHSASTRATCADGGK